MIIDSLIMLHTNTMTYIKTIFNICEAMDYMEQNGAYSIVFYNEIKDCYVKMTVIGDDDYDIVIVPNPNDYVISMLMECIF